MEQELTVILTGTEKRTALIGEHSCGLQFVNVDLAGAVFREADLAGADFRHADLQRAELLLGDLYGVDLTDACMEQATFRRSVGLSSAVRAYSRAHGGVV